MRGKAKQREMQALRAAGLTLAGAERLSQTRSGSPVMLVAIGGAAIALMAGIGVYTVNMPSTAVTTQSAAVVVTEQATPTPKRVPAATEKPEEMAPLPAPAPQVARPGGQSIDPATENPLPWVVALKDANNAAGEAKTVQTAQVPEDCVVTLAGEVADMRIQFGAGSAVVPPESYDVLAAVGAMAAACPEARVQVAGHSDSSGSDLANLQLSWTRAENTIEVLAALGIDTGQFETVGFGSRAPLQQGSSSEDGINRRVELRVLKGEAN